MSSTKIELEYPYNKDWKCGYLNVNSEGRRTLTLYNSSHVRSSTQYARYLISVSIGRYLTCNEQVDHIDNDKTNDDLRNLRVLSRKENITKENARRSKPKVVIRCPSCKISFERRRGNTQVIPSLRGKITCCSRSCSNKFLSYNFCNELRELISEESIIQK